MKEYLVISNSASLLRIAAEDILYIQANGHYSTITHCIGDAPVQHHVPCTIGDLFELIGKQLKRSTPYYIQVGRSLIINTSHIGNIDLHNGIVELWKNGTISLEVSKESLKRLKELLEQPVGMQQ